VIKFMHNEIHEILRSGGSRKSNTDNVRWMGGRPCHNLVWEPYLDRLGRLGEVLLLR
jgi:hypothetical protein